MNKNQIREFYNKHNTDRFFGIKINTPLGGFFTKLFIITPVLLVTLLIPIFLIIKNTKPPTPEEVIYKKEIESLSYYLEMFGMGCTCLEYYNKFNNDFPNTSNETEAIRLECANQYSRTSQLAKSKGEIEMFEKLLDMTEEELYQKACYYEKNY